MSDAADAASDADVCALTVALGTNAYTDAIATAATAATDSAVHRWTSRLGGADVYTRSDVLAMAEALRIDYGTLG